MNVVAILSLFLFISCEFKSKVDYLVNSDEKEEITSFGVRKVAPTESSGQSTIIDLEAYGLTVGKGVNLYSDPSCTDLVANDPSASTETIAFQRMINYGTNYYYIRVEEDDGSYSTCSSNGAYYNRLPEVPSTFSYSSDHSTLEIDPSPELRIGDLSQGSLVELFTDSNCTEKIAEGYKASSGSSLDIITDNLTTVGLHNIYARQTLLGTTTACSTSSIPYTNIIAPIGEINNHYSRMNVKYGNYMYALTNREGVNIYDISNPVNPTFIKKFRNSSEISSIYVHGSNLFIADPSKKVYIYDLTSPTSPTLVSGVEPYYDVDHMISDGTHLYAVAYNRLYIYNISDISNPTLAGVSYGMLSASTRGIALQGTTLFTAEQTAGLRIIDVSDPSAASEITNFTGITSPQKIVVSGNYAYINGYTSGLHITDISDLSNPSIVQTYSTSGRVISDFDLQDEHIYLTVDDFLSDLNFRVLDVSTPSSPVLVTSLITDNFIDDLLINDNHIYLGLSSSGIKVVDISTPSAANLVTNLQNFSGQVRQVELIGNYVYIADKKELQVYNITNPAVPTYVTTYTIDTTYSSSGSINTITVDGSYAYLAIGNAGMEIIDISNPASPVHVSVIDSTPSGNVYEIAVSGNYAYLADYDEGLIVVDISTKTSPTQVGSYSTSFARGVKVSGSHVFVSDTTDGYLVLDVSTPSSPTLASTVATPSLKSVINGSLAYMFPWGSENLYIYDISDPTNLTELSITTTSSDILDIALYGDYVFIANSSAAISIYDITDTSNPVLYKEYDQDSRNFYDIHVTADKIYTASGNESFEIYEYLIP